MFRLRIALLDRSAEARVSRQSYNKPSRRAHRARELLPPAFHIAAKKRGVACFVYSSRRHFEHGLCRIFLACREAIPIEFDKQDSYKESRALVPIDKRMVSDYSCRVNRSH